ncbi:DUF4367 domain-containing protein [Pseudoflavonifractor capillosus]|uniref:DUF4367 domain-containing protein n=1 Tax=Pseudoflavonifractor capillosus TaxID=106588 RepID=UPI00195AB13B|nr:DUF4367 domain-containing protein [Pseudoflavonifractor capillosus]MBM6897156.1 DUF4367 domain-containing protein [Pseudoflavonifractor capillosus]
MAEHDLRVTGTTQMPDANQLAQLSPEELAQAMEQALDEMTEDTYDQAVVNAYLDALDAKAPMPEMPDVDTSYQQFQSMLTGALPSRPKRRGRVLRMTLRVFLAAAFLFGCLVAAQASGMDVFGAMARWTDDTFYLETQKDHPAAQPRVPYQEKYEAAGLDAAYMPTWIPDGYTVGEIEIFELPDSTEICIPFYHSNDSTIQCFISSYSSPIDMQSLVFEKDGRPVKEYQVNGKTVYLFHNLDAIKAVCQHKNFVYTLTGDVTEDIALNFYASIGLDSQSTSS